MKPRALDILCALILTLSFARCVVSWTGAKKNENSACTAR